jgi:hypothetical protein
MLTSALSWYYRSFLCGFCYRIPLLLGLLFPVGLMLGDLGDEYGPRALLFHERPARAFIAGFSIGLFWLEVLFIGYLLWLRDRREGRLAGTLDEGAADDVPRHTFLGYAARTGVAAAATSLVVFLVVWALGQLFRAIEGTPGRPAELEVTRGFRPSGVAWFLVGLLVSLAAAVVAARLWRPPGDEAVGMNSGTVGEGDSDEGAGSLPKPAHLQTPTTPPGALERPEGGARRRGGAERLAAWLAVLAWVGMAAVVLRNWNGVVKDVAAVALTLAGLAATTLALLRVDRPWLGWVAIASNALLGYAAVTWCVSRCPLGAFAGAAVALTWAACLHFALGSVWPGARNWAAAASGRASAVMGRREAGYLRSGVACLIAGGGFLLVACATPALASAVPVIMLMLIGGFALAGLSAYLIRRSLVPVALALAFLALVANVQEYRYRFDGLPYATQDPGTGIIDLRAEAEQDAGRLAAWEGEVAEYRGLRSALEEAQVQLEANEFLLRQLRASPADAAQVAEAEGIVGDLARKKSLLSNRAAAQLQKVKRGWAELNANRVIAPRVPAGVGLDVELPVPFDPGKGLLPTKVLRGHNRHLNGAGEEKGPMIVIAVSGGGLRSAVWTYFVLEQLELAFARQGRDFPSHVRLITGASGGMLGASYYVCTLTPPDRRVAPDARATQLATQRKRLGSDFLYPLTRRAVLSDLPGLLSPWPMKYDRGKSLEAEWRGLLTPADPEARGLEQTFADLRQGELEGWRPSLVFTPMMVEDGRRLVVSNLDMRYATSNDGFVVGGNNSDKFQANHSVDALELFRMFPPAQSTLTVATAARMSASFPYFSPGVSLPTHPRRRVVDAGYYDNYGVCLASAWLLRGSTVGWLTDKADSVLVIQIRDGTSVDQRQLRAVPPDGSGLLSRASEEVTTPLEGLFAARVSSSSFRNDGALALLESSLLPGLDPKSSKKLFPKSAKESAFAIANFELAEGNVSLSWYLTEDQIGWIVGEVAGSPNRQRVEQLAAEIADYCATIRAP